MSTHRRGRSFGQAVRRRVGAFLVMVLATAIPVQIAGTGVAGAAGVEVIDAYEDLNAAFTALDTILGPGFAALGDDTEHIPFLGADLSQGTDPFSEATTTLNTFFAGITTDSSIDELKAELDNDKASLPGWITISDYRFDCGGGSCVSVSEIQSARIKVTASGSLDPDPIPFSLPLPGIDFKTTDPPTIDVDVPWKINVDLVSDGGAVRVEPAATGHAIELTDMALTVDAALDAEVGPLRLTATPVGTPGPGFRGTINIDLPAGTGSPTFALVDAKVDATWDLAVAVGSPMLGLGAQLHIAWDLSGSSVTPNGLVIELNHITLNAKELLGGTLTDVLGGLADLVEPIHSATQPLITPLPGFEDVVNAVRNAPPLFLQMPEPSLLAIAEVSGAVPPGVRRLIQNIDQLHKGLDLATNEGSFSLGSLKLTGIDALSNTSTPTMAMEEILDLCTECRQIVDEVLAALNDTVGVPAAGGLKFAFPVLEQPSILGQLLLGRNVDLVTFDTGNTLQFDQPIHVPLFSVFVFDVDLFGNVAGGLRLKGGFDTKGVKDAMQGGGVDELANGLYLENPGEPVARLSSTVGMRAVAGFPALSLGAGVKAEPNLNVKLVVPPGDRLRPFDNPGGIGCSLLEDPSAAADFDLALIAFITMPLGVPDIEHQITSVNFLSEEDICDPNGGFPVLGKVNPATGVLEIIPGSLRDPALAPGEADAISVVGELDAQDALQTIVLRGNGGAEQKFPVTGITGVSYTSPNGDNRPVQLRVLPTGTVSFDLPVTATTAGGKDFVSFDLAAGRIGLASLKGEDDRFVGGPGIDDVDGGEGADRIMGARGSDHLLGGPGNDLVGGDDDPDEVWGGPGDDNLSAGRGADNLVVGEAGKDHIFSGDDPAGDRLYGDEKAELGPEDEGAATGDKDYVVTGGGADWVIAGAGPDLVIPTPDSNFSPADAVGVRVLGNGGDDILITSDGPDQVWGGPGSDVINTQGGDDEAWGGTGSDSVTGGGGADRLYGDRGADTCAQSPSTLTAPAETATGGGPDVIDGGDGADQLAGEDGDDVLNGNGGADRLCGHAGVDTTNGGDDDDTAWGGSGDDTLNGGAGADAHYGGAGADTTDGGTGTDLVLGQADDDLDLRGGGDDDRIEGGPGADIVHGDDGADDILGGSSPGFVLPGETTASTGDTGDTLLSGGDGHDVIVGDNGVIIRTGGSDANNGSPVRVVTLREAATVGGGDTIGGDAGDDAIYAGAGADTAAGGLGDDHVEGNAAGDSLYGLAAVVGDVSGRDQDDIIGGSSSVNPDAMQVDTGDTIRGDLDRDVVIGDNGEILRPVDGAGLWQPDPITGGVLRAVVLADRALTGADLAARSGGDHVEGGSSLDRVYGQGGDDYLEGNEEDDQVEGNQGSDRIEGNDGDDDLVGGSSLLSAPGAGDPDEADRVAGGAGADIILGDNGAVSRAATPTGTPYWDSVTNTWLGFASRRSVTLYDLASLATDNFGADELSGGAGPDVLFGQDADDDVYGGPADDYMEGNGGADELHGDALAPPTGDPRESPSLLLDGPAEADGQDDQIGGSSRVVSTSGGAVTGHRDTADVIRGGGAADVQLGDNGRVVRRVVAGDYLTRMAETQRATVVRQAALAGGTPTALPARFDVGAGISSGRAGADSLFGDDGDDIQLGEDGNDTLYGGDDDDEMYGELGDDRMFGETGEDAMLGDRGVITNTLVTAPGAPFSTSSVPQMAFTPFAAHPYDRRVDMSTDGDGAPIQSPGISAGGVDLMRGGDDHDSLHGQTGNDVMNGDSGGDYLFGADGADVMWGGKGKECADPLDFVCNGDTGTNDALVDHLFGGRGLSTDPVTGGADLLDYRPRPGVDPAAWFEATDTEPGDATALHQHHQGIDWIYGGYDRDVLQGDIAANGPNPGDRLIDWTGAFNLYTHCNEAYGGYNDIRLHSPDMQDFLERLAFALGAGKTLVEVQTAGTSGFNELAMVRSKDVKANSGKAFPATPGHFDAFSCAP